MTDAVQGYSFNQGTYQTIILSMLNAKNDGLGKIRRAIMPEKLQKAKYRPQKRYNWLEIFPSILNFRGLLWFNEGIGKYMLPFPGADKSVVQRSQYFDATVNGAYPVGIETYVAVSSWFWGVMGMLWMMLLQFCVKYDFTRKFFQNNPGLCSGYTFSENGPTREQAKQVRLVDQDACIIPTASKYIFSRLPSPTGSSATAGRLTSPTSTSRLRNTWLPAAMALMPATSVPRDALCPPR